MSGRFETGASTACPVTETRGAEFGSALRGLPWLTACLALLAVGLAWLPGAFDSLVFDREAVGRGELWRLVTGHFVHWSAAHWVWDTAVFFALGAVCEVQGRKRLVSAVLVSALFVSLGIALFQPGLSRYAGLSGIDCTLFAWVALDWVRSQWRVGAHRAVMVGAGLALALAGKIGFELVTGSALFAGELAPGVGPVPLAHVLGAGVAPLFAIPVIKRKT